MLLLDSIQQLYRMRENCQERNTNIYGEELHSWPGLETWRGLTLGATLIVLRVTDIQIVNVCLQCLARPMNIAMFCRSGVMALLGASGDQ